MDGKLIMLASSALAIASTSSIVSASAAASSTSDASPQKTTTTEPNDSEDEIVVTAPHIAGTVKGDIPPELELDQTAVASYGASTISELLDALTPQTSSGRGRGSGGPVVLLNGRRISGLSEIRDLPPEAIEKVQILPEEVALKFGYSADQRVVNFILKDDFKALTAETKIAASTAGQRYEPEGQVTFVKLGKKGRTTLSADVSHDTPVLESQRGVIQRVQSVPTSLTGNVFGLPSGSEIDPALSALVGTPTTISALPSTSTAGLSSFVASANQPSSTNVGSYRTLLSSTDDLKLNAVINRALSNKVSFTFNGTYELTLNRSLLGLPSAILTVPPGSNSPFASAVGVSRAFGPALTRDARSDAVHGGVTFDGDAGQWQWTVTGTYDRNVATTWTDTGIDVTTLQTLVSAGTVNPFSTTLSPTFLPRDFARSQNDAAEAIATLSGPLLTLPAGPVRTTLRFGGSTLDYQSSAVRGGFASSAALNRNEANAKLNIDVPLASRKEGVAEALGNLTINGNFGYRQLSDFGALISFGYGLNWSPVEGMTILATAIGSDNEPSVQQLGNPLVVTPNVPVYDFTTGQNAMVTSTSGGNPGLISEKRRDVKLGFTYTPPRLSVLTLSANVFKNHSSNPPSAFPTLTPALEAAFPLRVVRDAAGRLVSIDNRAINVAETRSDVVRLGFNLARSFGQRAGGRGFSTGGGAGRGSGGFGGGGGGFGRGGGAGGRWQLAIYDSIRLVDQVVLAPGTAPLDLLHGAAIGASGGSPRHSVDLDAGWFNKGIGFRLTGNYSSGSTVIGTGTASTLTYSGLATLNAQAFFNFDSRPKLIEAMPFLKGSRLRIGINNITDAIRDVRDAAGAVPLSDQPAYLDPQGRTIEVSFRKRF